MSHRSSSHNNDNNTNNNYNNNNNNNNNTGRGNSNYRGRGRGRAQAQFQAQKYVPKTPIPSPTPPPPAQIPATLSSSLRNTSTTTTTPTTKTAPLAGRVQLGNNGQWVPSKKTGKDKGSFVNYLPQDEAVAIGLGAEDGGLDPVESQRVVDLLNRELANLLKLKPRDFWHKVAEDVSLHEFLDSYLQFRSRWYDFSYHGAKGTVAGVIVGDLELSRRVFMVLYRISSNKDLGARRGDSLSQRDHGVLLQNKNLLDLPKLLDICAIYGHENEDLTISLVGNAMNAQPGIHGTLTSMMSHFLGIVQTMYSRCTTSLEALISAGVCENHGPSRTHVECLEVMDFLNDAVVSMNTFINAYKPAAVFFSCPVESSQANEELINVLATLHDSLLPSLRKGLQIILASEEKTSSAVLSDASLSLKSLSSRIIELGWKLLDNCYLSDDLFKDDHPTPAAMKMFPANVEDPVIRADILIQTFKEIAAVPQRDQGKSLRGTFVQNLERDYQLMKRIEELQNDGWLIVDGEQYQYLAAMVAHPLMSAFSKKVATVPVSVTSDSLQMAEDSAIVESKISQVKDIFPDYGKGFILACLEVYDHNPEEVIQRILEGTLHEDLQSMDTSMKEPQKKPSPPLPRKDKGKGILVESTVVPSIKINSVPQSSKPEAITSSSSSSSSLPSSVGRFVRKSKDDEADLETLDSRDVKHVDRTAALLSQYEYEDEYDDSFDDLGMTTVESGVEETEILQERIKSNLSISSQGQTPSSASGSAPKWASKKKPQFYVKDGKNYSYKVEGAVAVSDVKQASLVTQVQKESIHGLGRGGNLPLGAVKKWEEQNLAEGDASDPSETDGGGDAGRGQGRGRGRRGGGGRHNFFRKDRAMKKHVASLGGF